MTRLLVEYLKDLYAVLDNAIQNSDHTDFEHCYWALDELCLLRGDKKICSRLLNRERLHFY